MKNEKALCICNIVEYFLVEYFLLIQQHNEERYDKAYYKYNDIFATVFITLIKKNFYNFDSLI